MEKLIVVILLFVIAWKGEKKLAKTRKGERKRRDYNMFLDD